VYNHRLQPSGHADLVVNSCERAGCENALRTNKITRSWSEAYQPSNGLATCQPAIKGFFVPELTMESSGQLHELNTV